MILIQRLILSKQRIGVSAFRNISVHLESSVPFESEAWQIQKYGGIEELERKTTRFPALKRADQVVIKVMAASINPLDVGMLGGYGVTALNLVRQTQSCSSEDALPLTVGRDFAGVVVAAGAAVEGLRIGDQVWGVVAPHMQGSHARHVLASSSCVVKKPKRLSMVESAALVYTAMTAWSALQVTGGLAVLGTTGRKVLVLGAAGGVGSVAVQLLLSWGAKVTALCRTDALPLVQSLGVTDVVDYTQTGLHTRLSESGKFDVIFDCAGLGTEGGAQYYQHLNNNLFSKYITLRSPLLREMDSKGALLGAVSSLIGLVQANLRPQLLPRFAPVRWAFFAPIPSALQELTTLVEKGKIRPCIDSIVTFDDTPEAFRKLQAGHARGKIVISMIDEAEGSDTRH